ncbi:MAG: hypothetical protein KDA65_17840, partial [Planctomycetaceae bacterium]|nr:hypothetical protein [Planctomycetaceae bacterium]
MNIFSEWKVLPALLVLFVSISSWITGNEISAAEILPPAIGSEVPNVTLVDIYRRERQLTEYQGKKAIVIAVLGVDCPLANLYIPR